MSLDMFWVYITYFGDERFYIFLLPIFYFLVDRRFGFRLLTILITSVWISSLIKGLLKLPIPPKELWKISMGYAFPSAHVLCSTSFWGYTIIEVNNRIHDIMRKRILNIFIVGLVVLIAYSRLYLGALLSEIIGGIIIGISIVLTARLFETRVKIKSIASENLLAIYVLAILFSYICVKDEMIVKSAALLSGVCVGHILSYNKLRYPKDVTAKIPLTIIGICISSSLIISKNALPIYLAYSITGFGVITIPHFIYTIYIKIKEAGYYHSRLFTIEPIKDAENFEDLPILEKNYALAALLVSSIGVVIMLFDLLKKIDPWAYQIWENENFGAMAFYVPTSLILLMLSLKIAHKQWNYYYREEGGGKKDGIFCESIRQVNDIERNVDLLLAIFGGLLSILSFTPIYWFLGLSFLSFLVIFRCWVTLRRKYYYSKLPNGLKNKMPKEVYCNALDKMHRGITVKEILAGWIVSDAIVLVYTFMSFLTLILIFGKIESFKLFVVMISLILVTFLLFFGLSKKSLEWGGKLIKLSENDFNESPVYRVILKFVSMMVKSKNSWLTISFFILWFILLFYSLYL